MATIHERIKQRRTELGYTLLYVAEKLNIKEATMQRYESGAIKNIKHETISELAKILNCDPAYLMGWTDSPTEPKKEYEELYLKLDNEDRAEIRGEMRQMLKAPKYNNNEPIQQAFAETLADEVNNAVKNVKTNV